MDKSNKSKVIISVIGVISLTVIVALSTYAWFKWRTNNNQIVNINLTASSTITFYGGNDVYALLEPVYDKEEGVSKSFTISNDADTGDTFNLYMYIKTLPGELQDSSFLWKIYKDGQPLDDGDNFENYAEDDNILLLEDEEIAEGDTEYTVYFWIDAYQDNDSSMSGKRVEVELYATGTTDNSFDEARS